MARKIIKVKGKEVSRPNNGLWREAAKESVRNAARKCTLGELATSDKNIVENVTSKMRPTRQTNLLKQETKFITDIAREVLNEKLSNLSQALNDDENEIRRQGSIQSNSTPPETPPESPQTPPTTPIIPGLESDGSQQSGSASSGQPSSLPSLPSAPSVASSHSSGNPWEAAEIFGFEPQEPFRPMTPPPEPPRVIDELDALEALDAADANIGMGIEDPILAEVAFEEIIQNIQD